MIDRLWCSWVFVAGFLGAGATACTEPSDEGSEPPPSCTAAAYRIEEVALAQTWGDAVQRGLDLDGDGDVDNKLGSLNATLTQLYGDWHPEAAIATLLEGDTAWLVRTERCAGSRRVAVSVGVGVDGDGDGAVEVADWGGPAIGEGNEARGGVGFVPVGRLGDGAGGGLAAGWSPELGLAIAMGPRRDELTATIGFGVEITDELLAPVAGFLSAALASGDSRFADGIDLDRDGKVSVVELRQAPAVRALLAGDLDLTVPCAGGECYQPGSDGVLDRISLGFGVVARPVAIE